MKLQSQQLLDDIESAFVALPVKTNPSVRALRKEYSQKLKAEPADLVLKLANLLVEKAIDQNEFFFRFIAYELLRYHPDALSTMKKDDVEKVGRGLDSWVSVDTFCTLVAGQVWRRGHITDGVIYEWAVSPDRWWRRAALVATVPLNNKTQGGNGDPERTLVLCRLLVDDRDDMVVKALSWALRELAKRASNSVREFMVEMDERLASRIRREVWNKLDTGLKNPK